MGSDFFFSHFGNARLARWRGHWSALRIGDFIFGLRILKSLKRAQKNAREIPAQKILVIAVKVPGRERELRRIIDDVSRGTVHNLTVALVPMENRGKFDNVNFASSHYDMTLFNWLLILDDDVLLPKRFLDVFIYFCYSEKLKIAQPAHRWFSFASYAITLRHWASNVRLSNFVEIGPITLFHSDTFSALLPFPQLRFGWGLDILWSVIAKKNSWRIGIVDVVPIRHMRPIGSSYNVQDAIQEAKGFLLEHDINANRGEILGVSTRVC